MEIRSSVSRFVTVSLAVGSAVGSLLTPLMGHAESTITSGAASPLTASARVDFQITIPKFLYLRVGSGTNYANNTTVDLIAFTIPATNVGDGTLFPAVGGDLAGGTVTARVIGNNGSITFGSTTTGPLSNGLGDSIQYSQITTTAAANTSAAILPAPALVSSATTNITLTPNIGTKVTNMDAKWTFNYLNAAVVPPGTYGGVNTNGGRVTYTASMP